MKKQTLRSGPWQEKQNRSRKILPGSGYLVKLTNASTQTLRFLNSCRSHFFKSLSLQGIKWPARIGSMDSIPSLPKSLARCNCILMEQERSRRQYWCPWGPRGLDSWVSGEELLDVQSADRYVLQPRHFQHHEWCRLVRQECWPCVICSPKIGQ